MKQTLLFLAIFVTAGAAAQVPAISSFSPLSGEVGTTVIIKGNNFSAVPAENVVFFGSVKANVLAAKTTELQVSSPAGTTFQPITVTVRNLTAYASLPFLTTFYSSGLNIDDNTFGNNIDFQTGKFPTQMAVSDLDGNDLPDIAVINSGDTLRADSTFSILLNRYATGSFTTASFAPQKVFVAGYRPGAITTGDLNGDGKPDLLIANVGIYGKYGTTLNLFINRSKPDSVGFDPKIQLNTGKRPISLTVTDLDGDGKPDIVVANREELFISVFQNITSGGVVKFAARVDVPLPGKPNGVKAGDLDGDGKPEIVVTLINNFTLTIVSNLSGLGTAGFAPQLKNFTTPKNPADLALADLDADGKLDIAFSNFSRDIIGQDGLLSVFRNLSTPGVILLDTRVDLEAGQLPLTLAIGDINGDTKPDLIATNKGSGDIIVLQNKCTSGKINKDLFTPRISFSAGSFPEGVVLADMNRDSKPDLIVANAGSQQLVGNTLSVLQNAIPLSIPVITSFSPASGSIGTTVTITGGNFSEVAASNFVFFGAVRAKVLTATSFQLTVSVPAGATLKPISVTNAGRTGYAAKPFLVSYPSSNRLDTASFAKAVNFEVKNLQTGVAVADLNNDGKPDILTGNFGIDSSPDSTLAVLRNISKKDTLAFAKYKNFQIGKGPRNLTYADLNGDGRLDVICISRDENTVSVFKNNSVGDSIYLGKRIVFKVGIKPYGITVGDVDSDGRPDLIVPNANDNTVSVLRNQSSPDTLIFSSKVDFQVDGFPLSAALADLDGDGKPEIVTANFFTNNISILQNLTAAGSIIPSSFAPQLRFSVGSLPTSVAIADIDNDGKPDISVGNLISGNVSVLQNQAEKGTLTTSSFASRINFSSGNPFGLTLADLDGDTKPELIVCNSFGDSISVHRNQYTTGVITPASFARRIAFKVIKNPFGIAVADLDGDGKNDMVVANNGGIDNQRSSVSVLRNLVLPPPPVIASYTPFTDIGPGGNFILQGNNFLEIKTITFGGIEQKNYNLLSATQISLSVPPKARNGYLVVSTRGGKDSIRFIAMDVPNLINGNSALCPGDTAVIFSVPPINGATSYGWTVPPGVAIASRKDSSTIRVNLSQNIINGNIQVQGINNGIAGRASQVFIFSAASFVNAPSSLTATAISPRQIDLKWSYVQPPKGIIIQRSRNGDDNFSLLANLTINPNNPQTAYTDQAVETKSTYFYRIQAYNSDCNSAFSNKVGAATPSDEVITALASPAESLLMLTPNPTDRLLSVRFLYQGSEKITLYLSNLLGQVLQTDTLSPENGTYHQELDLKAEPNGMYLLTLQGKNFKIVKRVSKQ